MPLEFLSNSSLSYNQNSLATQEGLEKIIGNFSPILRAINTKKPLFLLAILSKIVEKGLSFNFRLSNLYS